jgi:hypothetical protein
MGAHHTKDKGDLGTAMAYADLVSQGCIVLFPTTEHAPFDLVAYRSGRFYRVQVKYRTARSGKVVVSFRSSWADRHGTHMKPVDKAEIDALCIYCPDTEECYYVRPGDHNEVVTLRVAPARNGQQFGVRLASQFRRLPV